MVNRDRCICLLLMGASKATMLMSSSAADSGHLLGGKSLLSVHIRNQTKQSQQPMHFSKHGKVELHSRVCEFRICFNKFFGVEKTACG